MSNKRFSLYKNKDKLKAYRKRHKDRYYNRNKDNCINNNSRWTEEEIDLILYSNKTDTELSIELSRTIEAIQMKRHKCKEI